MGGHEALTSPGGHVDALGPRARQGPDLRHDDHHGRRQPRRLHDHRFVHLRRDRRARHAHRLRDRLHGISVARPVESRSRHGAARGDARRARSTHDVGSLVPRRVRRVRPRRDAETRGCGADARGCPSARARARRHHRRDGLRREPRCQWRRCPRLRRRDRGGARHELVPARAMDADVPVLGVDLGLHGEADDSPGSWRWQTLSGFHGLARPRSRRTSR